MTKQRGNNTRRKKKSKGTSGSAKTMAKATSQSENKSTTSSNDNESSTNTSTSTSPFYTYISILVVFLAFIWQWKESNFEIPTFHGLFQNNENSVVNDNSSKEATNIQNFLSWLENNGAIISPSVTIAPFHEFGGYGLQAKPKTTDNDYESNNDNDDDEYAIHHLDEMFTIPESIIISSKSVIHQFNTISKIPQFQSKMTNLLSHHIPSSYLVQQDVIIALYLMVQCELDENSLFKPYMDILPNYIIPRLDSFDEEELNFLQDEELKNLAKESHNQLQSLWQSNDLQDLLSSMIQAMKTIEQTQTQSQCITFHSFHKYMSIVSSRAMVLQGTKYLTPPAEFANYEPRYDERKRFNGRMGQSFTLYHERNNDNGSITVRSDRDVLYGKQIFEDYGDIDNSLYLEAHGFVPNENPFHCAMIPVKLIPSPKDVSITSRKAMVALKLLPEEKSELYPPPSISLLDDGSILDKRAEAYLTVAAMDANENQDLVTQCGKALDSNDEELIQLQCLHFIGNKDILNQFIHSIATKSICQLESKLKDDLRLLDSFLGGDNNLDSNGKDMTKKILALKFRISDKSILYKVTAKTDDDLDCLHIDEKALPKKKPLFHDYAVQKANMEDQTTSLLQKFNAFIDSLDMPVRNIEATVAGDMRIGVVAKEDIDEGDVYLSINTSSVINSNTARVIEETSKMNTILNHNRSSSKDGGFDLLLLFLMHEKFILKEKSKWHAYIDLLPTIEDMKQSSPLFIDEELYDYAAGSDLRGFLLRHKRKAEDLFISMYLNKDILGALGQNVMQKDNFFWAYSIIDSRSIWWSGKRHLAPLLDLVNCMEQLNGAGLPTTVHKTFVDESNYAITKAARAFKKGEQIFENYGQPNHIYFMYHGFTLGENNTHDCAHWGELRITPNDKGAQNLMEAKSRLSKSGFSSLNPSFCIKDGSSLDRVAQFLRVKYGLDKNDDEMGLSSDVLPYVKQHLSDRIRRYKETKRTLDASLKLPKQVTYMVDIVNKEMYYFKTALDVVA